jgi:hypothetical protein
MAQEFVVSLEDLVEVEGAEDESSVGSHLRDGTQSTCAEIISE